MSTKLENLSDQERWEYFRAVSAKTNISAEIIEKDFWIIWILKKVLLVENLSSFLTFKGGTSLSKVFNLIQRFSEDVDLSIEKTFFDLGESVDPEKASSRNKQKAALDKLTEACTKYIREEFITNLTKLVRQDLVKQEWSLTIDNTDVQTVLFDYPKIQTGTGYILPVVKLEMGCRSEHWPVTKHSFGSSVKNILGDEIQETPVSINVLDAERTFWEKATILHQYAHLPKNKNLPARISRHYYDLYSLLNSKIKESALKKKDLLESVSKHKSIYFASAWASYDTALKGSLKLIPSDKILKELQKDYQLMNTMIFEEVPNWNIIVKNIVEFEKDFNRSGII